jgi:papilin
MFSTRYFTYIMILIGMAMAMPLRMNQLGGCEATEFGCCHDGISFCQNQNCTECLVTELGGCLGTLYGCCPDRVNPCQNDGCANCLSVNIIGGCTGTKYGCCPDLLTPCNTTQCENCISEL